jgi:type IV secretory pathway VirJ component
MTSSGRVRIRRRPRSAAIAISALLCTSAALGRPLRAQSSRDRNGTVDALPLHETPVSTAGLRLVVLITGDGGYARGDRSMAATFAARGIPVVALDARAYLARPRLPEEAASDVAHVMAQYLTAWRRDSVVLVGYSRGADMAPFIVRRLPPELRARISLVAMVGLGDHASFEFHWTDLLRDSRRSTDRAVLPELSQIHGVRMLCLYGTEEMHSVCPALSSPEIRVDRHTGDHVLSGDAGAEVVRRVLRELEPTRDP